MGLSGFGIGIITWYFSKSFQLGLTLGLIGVGIAIILLFYRKFKFNEKVRKSKIKDIDTMTGTQFEYFLKLIFTDQGYKVQTTKVTGDFGADLVMTKGEKRIVVQAKRYNSRVGIKAIQEVVSSIAHYQANEGWVVTNNEFTDAAIQLAKSNRIKLIERNELIQMLSSLEEQQTAKTIQEVATSHEVETCPKCGSELVLRKGSRGQFYGCSGFPKCRYTRNVE
ncbi:restriction endonuclease [Pseudoneobacillus sp. C159]